MTDIGVFTLPYQTENRSWLLNNNIDDVYTVGCTILVSAFSATAHYPNGYIPSGTVLGKITSQSTNGALVVGPYDPNASDGRQTAVGILFASVRVWTPLGAPLVKVGAAAVVAWGVVSLGQLPLASNNSSGTSRTVTDGATTASSTTVTSATAAFTTADVGASISGGSIPAGATIASVTNGTTVVISAAATATATSVSLAIADRAGGFLDTAAQTALNHLHFVA